MKYLFSSFLLYLFITILSAQFVSADINVTLASEFRGIEVNLNPDSAPPGDLFYWRLDGTNAPPSASWNMGNNAIKFITTAISRGINWTYFGAPVYSMDFDGASFVHKAYSGANIVFGSGDTNKIKVIFTDNITAPNICYSNGVNCTSTGGGSSNITGLTNPINETLKIVFDDGLAQTPFIIFNATSVGGGKYSFDLLGTGNIFNFGSMFLKNMRTGLNVIEVKDNNDVQFFSNVRASNLCYSDGVNCTSSSSGGNLTVDTLNVSGIGTYQGTESALLVGRNAIVEPLSGQAIGTGGGIFINTQDDDAASLKVNGSFHQQRITAHTYDFFTMDNPNPQVTFGASTNSSDGVDAGHYFYYQIGQTTNTNIRFYEDSLSVTRVNADPLEYYRIRSASSNTGTNKIGQNLILLSGNTTGNKGTNVTIAVTPYNQASGTTRRNPDEVVYVLKNNTLGMLRLNGALKLDSITIPNNHTLYAGMLARNSSGLYYANESGYWVKLA